LQFIKIINDKLLYLLKNEIITGGNLKMIKYKIVACAMNTPQEDLSASLGMAKEFLKHANPKMETVLKIAAILALSSLLSSYPGSIIPLLLLSIPVAEALPVQQTPHGNYSTLGLVVSGSCGNRYAETSAHVGDLSGTNIHGKFKLVFGEGAKRACAETSDLILKFLECLCSDGRTLDPCKGGSGAGCTTAKTEIKDFWQRRTEVSLSPPTNRGLGTGCLKTGFQEPCSVESALGLALVIIGIAALVVVGIRGVAALRR
jgi:hypothetical protein